MDQPINYHQKYYQEHKNELKERNKLLQRTKYQDESERLKILERNRQRYRVRNEAYRAQQSQAQPIAP
jgi:hypothetical protein